MPVPEGTPGEKVGSREAQGGAVEERVAGEYEHRHRPAGYVSARSSTRGSVAGKPDH